MLRPITNKGVQTGDREFDFEKDGFTILRSVFSEQQLADLRVSLHAIIDIGERELEDPFEGPYLRHRTDQGVLYDLYQRHPEFGPFARNERVLDAVTEVIGPDVLLYENSVVYKPRGKRNGVPFHQDFISRPNEPRKYIAWMAIDPVMRDGGALKIIRGSHKTGFLPWHRVAGETHHDRINEGAVDVSEPYHVELNPGDVLIFNQLVVHGSDEAHTDSLRLVYRVSYQGFEEIISPRGAPLVMRGGCPDRLASRFARAHQELPRKSVIRRVVNKVGRALTSF